MNLNLKSLFHHSDMYELIRFMYKHIYSRYKKVNPKNELGEILLLTTLHFGKDLNLLHSTKCSISTQLHTYKKYSTTRFQSVQSRILQGQSLKLLKYLFTLKIEYFANSEIFCNFLDF